MIFVTAGIQKCWKINDFQTFLMTAGIQKCWNVNDVQTFLITSDLQKRWKINVFCDRGYTKMLENQ